MSKNYFELRAEDPIYQQRLAEQTERDDLALEFIEARRKALENRTEEPIKPWHRPSP